MSEKLVTAVVITHNRIELLKKAVQSILNQSYPNIELIVVDDASNDTTKPVFEELSKDSGFKYIYIPAEESKGGNHARNVGINAAQGEYVAFLDDDDEWLPDKIKKQVEYLECHSDCDVVHCGKIYEYNFDVQKTRPVADLAEGDFRSKVWSKVPFTTSCLMVRRSLFDRIGEFDENLRFWQEYEFAIRVTTVTIIGVVREDLVLYRIIQTDKNRLTNKVAGWEDAVSYIETKHHTSLENLSKDQLKEHEKFVCKDGVLRASNGNDLKAKRKYLKKLFFLEPNIKSFLRWILNVEALKEKNKIGI